VYALPGAESFFKKGQKAALFQKTFLRFSLPSVKSTLWGQISPLVRFACYGYPYKGKR